MPSEEVLDFERLLAPVSDEEPCGRDPRDDATPTSLYYGVKAARRLARDQERLAALPPDPEQPPPPTPDWRPVSETALKLLAQAKDLEVAAWLVEAELRRKGFAGLRDGFRLLREYCERYWDTIYPRPDAEGLLSRTAPLAGLNGDDAEGTLAAPLLRVTITQGRSFGPFTRLDLHEARIAEKIADPQRRESRLAELGCTTQQFQTAVKETSPQFFHDLIDDLQASQQEYARLTALLDEKCGEQSPPSSQLKQLLEEALDEIREVAKPVIGGTEVPAPAEGEAAEPGATAPGSGLIRTREDAHRQLERVAEYFRNNEPHNPISYALEQAVRWSKMPLPELLTELISDKGPRDQLFRLLGIRQGGD